MESTKNTPHFKSELATAQVPGLEIFEDFISAREEHDLITALDKEDWDLSLKRRTQHYGYFLSFACELHLILVLRYRYDYQQKSINKDNFLGGLPSWNDSVIAKLKEANIVTETPQQLLVNEYEPGQGISRHTDSSIFDEPVITLSLGSGCIFVLSQKPTRIEIYLKPKSLVILRGDSRWKWSHEIPSRKSDQVDGIKVHRGRRISLTYRYVKK